MSNEAMLLNLAAWAIVLIGLAVLMLVFVVKYEIKQNEHLRALREAATGDLVALPVKPSAG